MKLNLLVLLVVCISVGLAELDVPQRGLIHQIRKGVAGPNPYIFLTVPKGRSQALVHGFEVIEENDHKNIKSPNDDDFDDIEEIYNDEESTSADAHDDSDDDQQLDNEENEEIKDSNDNLVEEIDAGDDNNGDNDNDELDNVMSVNLKLRKSKPQVKNAKATQMMVSRDHAGAIMVPEEIIEIEGKSVIDERTGEPALMLPRSVLDSIPDGSVVALLERLADDEAEERANRVIVRRRRKGARRNIKRRGGTNNRYRVVRRKGNKSRKNVRVVRRGTRPNNKNRRVNLRRIYIQI